MNNPFIFYFFKIRIKIAESALECRVGRVSGNTGIFLGLLMVILMLKYTKLYLRMTSVLLKLVLMAVILEITRSIVRKELM